MIDNYTTNPIYLYRNVNQSFILLNKSIQSFDKSLQEKDFLELRRVYYFAKGCRKAAERHYQKALNNARILAKCNRETLEKNKMLVVAVDFRDVQAELLMDKTLRNWMTEEEIKSFLNEHFEEQTRGKRKLSNIKLRMILRKLEELFLITEELAEKAKKALCE